MTINTYYAETKKISDFDHNTVFNEILFEGRKYTLDTPPTDNKINRLTLFWDDPAPIISSENTQEFSTTTSKDNLIHSQNKVLKAYKKSHQYPFVNELKSNRPLFLPSQNQNNDDSTHNVNLLESPLNLFNSSSPQTSIENEFHDQDMHSKAQALQCDIDLSITTQNNSEYADSLFPILFSDDELSDDKLSEIQDLFSVPNLSTSNQATPILQFNETIHPPTSSFTISKISGTFTETKVCNFCNATETPEWRRGPGGLETLCNACGLKYAKQRRVTSKKPTQTISQIIPPSIFPNSHEPQNPQDHVSETQPIFPFPRTADMQFGNYNEIPIAPIASRQPQNTSCYIMKAISKGRGRGRPTLKRQGFCDNCKTQKTTIDKNSGLPRWRTGPKGPMTLCNACGLQYVREKK